MSATVCPNCGSQVVTPGAAFCDNCGMSLAASVPTPAAPAGAPSPGSSPALVGGMVSCPACGSQNMAGTAFCDNCGAALPAAPPAGMPVQVHPPQIPTPVPTSAPQAPVPAVGMVSCPSCGSQHMAGVAFCDNCGTSLSSVPPTHTPGVVPTAPSQTAPPYSAQPAAPAVTPRLVVQATNVSISFPPGKAEIIIGREDPVSNSFPDVDLGAHGGDQKGVSRKHAKVVIRGTQCFIEDLGAANYTLLNRQKLQHKVPQLVNNGDELCFGHLVTTFYTS